MTLRELRKKQGFTQEQLAQKIGITGQAVANYENGKRIPSIKIVPSYATELKVSYHEFIETVLRR